MINFRLSRRSKTLLGVFFVLILAFGSYCAIKIIQQENPFLNLTVVEPGVLIRSGEPYIGDLEDIYEDYGIRTILCLNKGEDREIKDFAEAHGIRIVCMDMRAARPPTEKQVDLFFKMLQGKEIRLKKYSLVIEECVGCLDRKIEFEKPILVHCLGGSDRTGIMIALYRIQFQGWTKGKAKREMIRHFHVPLHYPALFEFLDEYEIYQEPPPGGLEGL